MIPDFFQHMISSDKQGINVILFQGTIEKNIRDNSIGNTCFERKYMENINEKLIGKTVLNAKGNIIGRIQESIKDSVSGEIISVLITPSKELNLKKYIVTEHGEIVFPFSSLSSVKDIFIIEEPVQ